MKSKPRPASARRPHDSAVPVSLVRSADDSAIQLARTTPLAIVAGPLPLLLRLDTDELRQAVQQLR